MEHLVLSTLGLLLILFVFFSFSFYFFLRPRKSGLESRRVLLVISHPDDECMFFGPTLVNLCRVNARNVFLVCLSTGDFNKQGHVRKEELYTSCALLGVPQQNITVLNYTRLKDDPKAKWGDKLISGVIERFVLANDIDAVISFDKSGVSGHRNHVAIFNALVLLCLEERLPREVHLYCLRTVNILRKYSSVMDVPLTFLNAGTVFVAGPQGWRRIREAMRSHHSQYVWFRRLFMLVSRYALINNLERLVSPREKQRLKEA